MSKRDKPMRMISVHMKLMRLLFFRWREKASVLLMWAPARVSRRSTGALSLELDHLTVGKVQKSTSSKIGMRRTLEHFIIRAIRQLDGYYLKDRTLNIEIR